MAGGKRKRVDGKEKLENRTRKGGGGETRVVVEVVEGIGEVKWSCRVALAELTPHSPDQSRQVGR